MLVQRLFLLQHLISHYYGCLESMQKSLGSINAWFIHEKKWYGSHHFSFYWWNIIPLLTNEKYLQKHLQSFFCFKWRNPKSYTLHIWAILSHLWINEVGNPRSKSTWNCRACLKIELKLNSMYDSNLVGDRSWQKLKVFQATF